MEEGSFSMSFEVFLKQSDGPSHKRRLTYVLSVSLHIALVCVGGVHSFWHVDEITPPGVSVTFMGGIAVPPPPPPPPPVAKKLTATRIKPAQIIPKRPDELVQPPKGRQEPAEEAGGDEGEEDSVVPGLQSGVAGGAPEGSAVLEPPAPAARKIVEVAPVLLPPSVGTSQRLTDITDPAFRPALPPGLNRAGMAVRSLLRICVSIEGTVTDVKFIRSGDPAVDRGWEATIRRWRYRPFMVQGRPTPFCHPLMLEVRAVG
jgi:protein TonB